MKKFLTVVATGLVFSLPGVAQSKKSSKQSKSVRSTVKTTHQSTSRGLTAHRGDANVNAATGANSAKAVNHELERLEQQSAKLETRKPGAKPAPKALPKAYKASSASAEKTPRINFTAKPPKATASKGGSRGRSAGVKKIH